MPDALLFQALRRQASRRPLSAAGSAAKTAPKASEGGVAAAAAAAVAASDRDDSVAIGDAYGSSCTVEERAKSLQAPASLPPPRPLPPPPPGLPAHGVPPVEWTDPTDHAADDLCPTDRGWVNGPGDGEAVPPPPPVSKNDDDDDDDDDDACACLRGVSCAIAWRSSYGDSEIETAAEGGAGLATAGALAALAAPAAPAAPSAARAGLPVPRSSSENDARKDARIRSSSTAMRFRYPASESSASAAFFRITRLPLLPLPPPVPLSFPLLARDGEALMFAVAASACCCCCCCCTSCDSCACSKATSSTRHFIAAVMVPASCKGRHRLATARATAAHSVSVAPNTCPRESARGRRAVSSVSSPPPFTNAAAAATASYS